MGRMNLTNIESDLWLSADRILLAHGTISGVAFSERSDITESFYVNLISIVRICELVLSRNPKARIVVMGSESATKGSHDIAYWLSKAALHEYVRNRKLEHPTQQLACVAPSMVMNTGMTNQKDPERVRQSILAHPKERGIEPLEVARLIYFLLFTDEGYITNTVIEMNGGKFARRGA